MVQGVRKLWFLHPQWPVCINGFVRYGNNLKHTSPLSEKNQKDNTPLEKLYRPGNLPTIDSA